jgi:hypothetical protein
MSADMGVQGSGDVRKWLFERAVLDAHSHPWATAA